VLDLEVIGGGAGACFVPNCDVASAPHVHGRRGFLESLLVSSGPDPRSAVTLACRSDAPVYCKRRPFLDLS
jgi:hypothetical protein